MNGTTTCYVGNYLEWTGSTSTMVKYYYAGSERVAERVGSTTVYYLLGDHLGSTYKTVDGSGSPVSMLRYKAYGETRYTNGTTPTSFRFTGQRHDGYINLYFMGAREYDPYINRWVSPDTVIPDPENPQSLNRYSYCLGNPLKLVDPSGHDPLDEAWQAEFRKVHGRDPTAEDMLIRLFSIAFPGEWNSDTWNALYTSDGQLRTEAFDLFDTIPEGRNWAGMPEAIEQMAGWYKENETSAFMRDIGSLFGGLRTRFESDWLGAVTGDVVHHFVSVGHEGLPTELIGNDVNGNVHHWAWTVNLGYFCGGQVAGYINVTREVLTGSPWDPNFRADVRLGTVGANMGNFMQRGILPNRSPSEFQSAWRLMPLQVSK